MKLPTTIKLGAVFIENIETGEEVILGYLPKMRTVAVETRPETGDAPGSIQLSFRYTWWSRVKMRLFIWRTGFVARYYYRKWAK